MSLSRSKGDIGIVLYQAYDLGGLYTSLPCSFITTAYYAYISQSDVEQLKQSGICYHLRMSGERIIAKVNIIDKPILDNIVDNNRSVNCATGSTIKI